MTVALIRYTRSRGRRHLYRGLSGLPRTAKRQVEHRRSAEQLPPEEQCRRIARHESSFSPDWAPAWEPRPHSHREGRYETRWAVGVREAQPDNDMQALMEAKPFEDPSESLLSSLDLKDRLAAAIDALPQRERWVFEAHHYRGKSFRQIARELSFSKTTADRIYRDAKRTLRKELSD